ncbi:MAG: hypothetical protein VX498_11125 [Myxococcota bacterium]|nr:hypothetical protein [Myxococcota bacterium]
MPRFFFLLLVVGLLVTTVVPRSAQAGSVTGAVLNPSGEKSHNVAGPWPEIFNVWEGLSRERFALGPRIGLQVYPFSWSVGLNVRARIMERGKVSLAMLVVPSFSMAGFGHRGIHYPDNYRFGQSLTFRPTMGPGANVGILATIDVSPTLHINLALENHFSFWILRLPNGATGWWFEWPVLLAGGVEYDLSDTVSLFGRLGGGPSVAFAGSGTALGVHFDAHFGAQFRYR